MKKKYLTFIAKDHSFIRECSSEIDVTSGCNIEILFPIRMSC